MAKTAQTKNKKTLVLLDAHAIIHRAYHALPDFSSSKGEPTGGLYGLSSMLINIVRELQPDYMVACFDLPEPTYRHEIYKEYKAGRSKADDELVSQLNRSRDVFKAFNVPIYDKPGFEADDMLGTIVEQVKGNKELRVVIASGDMDTLQLVRDDEVLVYTLKKGIKDTILYNEKAVVDRFGFTPDMLPDYKGLRGDPSDNIIGVKGIGEKTATELLTQFGGIEDIYKKLKKDTAQFEQKGIKPRIINLLLDNEEEALFSKELATIRRDAPITFSLPEQEWQEGLDISEVNLLFAELEFRTLGSRLKEVLGIATPVEEKKQESVDPKRLHETLVALWVLDSNITNPTLEDLYNYTGTESFSDAQALVEKELKEKKLDRVFETIEKPLIPILDDMKAVGIKIDTEYFSRMSKEYHKHIDAVEKKIFALAGKEFNVSSPKQLGEILFEDLGLVSKKKTAGGARSTKESVLQTLKDEHEIIPLILEYRELTKLTGTYIDAIPKLVGDDGRVHGTFLQTGAVTGRMASQDPNLQNIPNSAEHGKAIRKGFVADDGYVLLACDYSQIELRIAAFLSGDEKLIEVFRNGEDVHTRVASEVFEVAPEEVTKDMRRKAKVINFGILYGMGVTALKDALGTDRKEAQKFYNDYFEKFSTLAKYLDDVKLLTHKRGYTETFFGRRRYFEGIDSKLPFVRAQAERMAINAPIQGTGADIVKLAMISITEWITKEGLESDVRMLLQVHDELVFEVQKERVAEYAREIQSRMKDVIDTKDTQGVPLLTDASVGSNWGDMKSV